MKIQAQTSDKQKDRAFNTDVRGDRHGVPGGFSPLDEGRGELLREASIEAEASGRVKTREESGPARSLLVFYLGSEGFAVDLVHVRKVMRPSRIARVSGAAPEVLGLMNCQGEVLCVLDLRRILSQGKETDPPVATEGKFIVVVQHGGKEAGFLVDAVRDVAELPASPSARCSIRSIRPGPASSRGRWRAAGGSSACCRRRRA